MDIEITRWINSFAGMNPALDSFMIAVTWIGVPIIVALAMAQWWSRTDRRHVRHAAICSGFAFLSGLAINQGILLFIQRPRPYDAGVTHLIIQKSVDWSFPSDHATASMAVAAAFLIQRLPGRAFVFFLLAFVVCLSRVYLGTHYLSDVVGGAATGAIAAILVHLVYRENSRLDRFATGIL